jgi:hypothetical protein
MCLLVVDRDQFFAVAKHCAIVTRFSRMICSDMPAAAPIADLHDDAADPEDRDLLDRQLARLERLADIGMAMAEAIGRQATEPGPDSGADLSHAALGFSRVARAVRMTLALQSKLVTDFKTRSRPAAGGAEDDDEPETIEVLWLGERSRAEKAKQARLERAVSHAAHDTDLDRDSVERLVVEAGERLERDDIWDALKTLTFDEAVARICADLGLAASPIAAPTSPIAEAMGREGPRAEERVVGAGGAHHASAAPVHNSS